MKISGFTFIRNGELLGYPFIESIHSILPLVDEFVIAMGKSDDATLDMLKSIDSNKIKIIETVWNESMRSKGYVYSQQKMIAQFACTGDWLFYLEGDEVVHEADLEYLKSMMAKYKDDAEVEALAFKYHHFYGSPQYIAISPDWYRSAARIIKSSVRSFAPDGLYWAVIPDRWVGGRNKRRNRYPRACLLDAYMYHYGHVRNPGRMAEKMRRTNKYWNWNTDVADSQIYQSVPADNLAIFNGSHPKVVESWLEDSANRHFSPNESITAKPKHQVMKRLEALFGLELSKKHFKIVKKDLR
jgi:hypothetical protein